MKEFIEKLIGSFRDCTTIEDYGELFVSLDEVENIICEFAEEYKYKDCSECSRRKFYQQGYEDAKKEYINTSTDTSSDISSGWIPCSSGNFSTSEVLVCKEDGTIDFDVFDFMVEDWKFNSNHHKNKVIAWQPLPQPYAEQPTWQQQTMNRFERVE